MATTLGKNTLFQISSDGTTYTTVGKVLTISRRSEQTDDERIYVLGDASPITEAGDDEGTIDITVLRDKADTTGQNAIRTARAAATAVKTRILWDGVDGEDRDYKITAIVTDSDPNGTGVSRFVRETWTLVSAGDVAEYTAA